jgi:hypothetical protein
MQSRGLDDATEAGLRDAVVTALQPTQPRRGVQAVSQPERLAAMRACRDATCFGAQIAEANGAVGVLLRFRRFGPNAPVQITIALADPVSGASRGEPIQGTIEAAMVATPAETLAPLLAELAPHMPSPPPISSLLMAINVDGATVQVDDAEVGLSPVGPVTLEAGQHTVMVTRPGYRSLRRAIDLGIGEHARINVDLEMDPATAALMNEQQEESEASGSTGGPEGPFYTRWYVIAGAGAAVAVLATVVIVVVASSGDDGGQGGIPVPPIQ